MLLRSLIFLLFASVTNASWLIPPHFEVVEGGDNGKTFLRKNNKDGTIEIRDSGDFKVLWKVKIENYHHVFSSNVKLNSKSNILVHLVGNHKIRSLEDDCIVVYTDEGKRFTYKVKDFYSVLLTPQNSKSDLYSTIRSTDPRYHWIKNVNFIAESGINITLADKRIVILGLDQKSVAFRK